MFSVYTIFKFFFDVFFTETHHFNKTDEKNEIKKSKF